MTYYGQGLGEIANGLKAIAKAMEVAAEKQGKPINYTIVVNVAPGSDAEAVASKVTETIQRAEVRRGRTR